MLRLFCSVICIYFLSLPVQGKRVALVVPLPHAAMDQIEAGFRKGLGPDHDLVVKNAMGDAVLQQQILCQLARQEIDVIATIGTATTQSALKFIKTKPVVGVASVLEKDVLASYPAVTLIQDEVSVIPVVAFLKKVAPEIRTIGLLYGNSEKIFPEVSLAEKACEKAGVLLKKAKVDTVADVFGAAKALVRQCDAILVLKDHTVVSGITAILKAAKPHKTLVMTMDEGSVAQGAHIALGVQESEIGVLSGQKTRDLLANKNPSKERVFQVEKVHIFVNQETFSDQDKTSFSKVREQALEAGYAFATLGEKVHG